jgi:hypothetical protein
MEKIGEILKNYLSSLNLDEKIREQEIIRVAKDFLLTNFEIDGDVDYKNRVLKITIDDASLKYEIMLKRDDIINSINKSLGKKEIDKILVIS